MDDTISTQSRNASVVDFARQLLSELGRQKTMFGSDECDLGIEELQELAEITDELYTGVRGLQNAAKPIHKLPSEVLIKVFSSVPTAWTYPISFDTSTNVKDVKELCPLLLVCRYWRDIILGTPALWSTMLEEAPFIRPPAFPSYAHRCPVGPLYVVGEQGVSGTLYELLVGEGHRVRELHVTFPTTTWKRMNHYRLLLQASLPSLERCVLDHEPDPNHVYTGERLSLFPDSSKLRALSLIHPSIIPSSRFPALTALNLSRPTFQGLHLGALMDFLSGTPNLVQLRLSHVCPSTLEAVATGDWPERRIPLDHLRSFIVEETEQRWTRNVGKNPIITAYHRELFSVLSFPLSCTISMRHVVHLSTAATLLDAAWGPADRHKTLHARFSTGLSPHMNMEERERFGGSFTVKLVDPEAVRGAVKFSIDVPHDNRTQHAVQNVNTDLPPPPQTRRAPSWFSIIRKLWVEKEILWPRKFGEDAIQVLSSLPYLDSLVIEGPRTEAYIPILAEHSLAVTDNGRVLCPSLTTLMIHIVMETPGAETCPQLHAIAAARAAAGRPIRRLMVTVTGGYTLSYDGPWCRIYDGDGTMTREMKLKKAYRKLAAEWAEGMNLVR